MAKEISLEEISKFWPKDAPSIQNIPKYISKYFLILLMLGAV